MWQLENARSKPPWDFGKWGSHMRKSQRSLVIFPIFYEIETQWIMFFLMAASHGHRPFVRSS